MSFLYFKPFVSGSEGHAPFIMRLLLCASTVISFNYYNRAYNEGLHKAEVMPLRTGADSFRDTVRR